MGPKENPIDPEDPLTELAAEATNESTPAKPLYGDDKTKKNPTRKPGRNRNTDRLDRVKQKLG